MQIPDTRTPPIFSQFYLCMMRHRLHLREGIHEFYFKGIIRLDVSQGTTIKWRTSVVDYLSILPDSARYVCTCHPTIWKDEKARFAQQVVLELPDGSLDRARRLREGMTTTVCVDPCIVDAIRQLWSLGIETMGCCCGHNVTCATVSVHPKDYERMFELGYEQRPVDVTSAGVVMGLYTFYL